MIGFIDDYRATFGVEPICKTLPIAPSTYYAAKAVEKTPDRASPRSKRDADFKEVMGKLWKDNRSVYGYKKLWHALRREGQEVARCTVARLMREMGLRGVVRGKKVITTNPDVAQPCPDDKVNRKFKAQRPDQLWVSDFTYVSTWSGMVYVAFVIDVFARRIVGWRVSTSMSTQFVLDALNQAIWQRKPHGENGLIHHSDRGSQYLSIKYTERLAAVEIDASVGTVGDSYDNARCTAPSQRRLSACSRQRSSTTSARGNQCARSSGKPLGGSTGSTTAACSNPSDTSHPQKLRRLSMQI
jgi:transposase InsO family protein